MRKYQQLLLLIVSIISVVLLLIYRHEYLRLRYVLEVLNFFGTPPKKGQIAINQVQLSGWIPQPGWQRITEHLYGYSAFRSRENDVKMLALGRPMIGSFSKDSCFLWYEDESEPVAGVFSHTPLMKSPLYTDYMLLCRAKKVSSQRSPFAVSILDSPPIQVEDNQRWHNKISELTVCVLPSSSYVDPKALINFVAFYQFLGVDDFIFYSQMIPPRIQNFLHQAANVLNFGFTILPWNIPFQIPQINVEEIIKEDCLTRTLTRSKFVLIVNINDFTVPKYVKSLLSMDLINSENLEGITRFNVPIVKFCINPMPVNNILQNVRYIPESKPDVFSFYNNFAISNNKSMKTHSFDLETIALHRYISDCKGQETLSDNTALTYFNDVNNSELKMMYDKSH